jgi:predicted enzyme related to lactoylglutathione lyase
MNHNQIDYVEFPAQDVAAVKQFYASVFGWQFTDYGPTYTSFSDGRLSGGFQADAANPKPLVILYSKDLEASFAAVNAAGGRIVKEIFSFPGGRRFHFEDPAGNELAVWSE